MKNFIEILNEIVKWVVYDEETGKLVHSMGKSWASHKGAAAACEKYKEKFPKAKVASFIWYSDNFIQGK